MEIIGLEPLEGGSFRLRLANGSALKVSSALVADMRLAKGADLQEHQLEELNMRVEQARLRQRAAEMIGRRAMSKKELIKKLREKGEDPDMAEEAACWMEDMGFVNDEEYAASLVRKYSAKGYGPSRIKSEFYSRGVPREYWDEALEALEDPSDELDRFIMNRLKGEKPDQKQLKKVTDALYRRGHSWDDIRSAVNRYYDTLDN